MQLCVYLHIYIYAKSVAFLIIYLPSLYEPIFAHRIETCTFGHFHTFSKRLPSPSPAWLRSCVLNAAWLGGGAGCGQAGGARLRGPGRWKIMCSNFVQAVAVLAAVREGEGAVHCRQSIQLAPPPANRDGNEPSRSSTVPES